MNCFWQYLKFSRSFLLGKLCLFGFGLVHAQSVPNSDIIFYQDFDHRSLGSYGATELAADWLGAGSPATNKQQLSITDGKWAYSGKALRVRYPKDLSNEANVQWQSKFGQIYDELYLSYRIRFGDDMDFVLGGKLPGFYGGNSPTGGNAASGYFGFSSRLMWRSNSGGFSFPAGKTALTAYCYYVKPFNPWDTSASDDIAMNGVYTPGKWYQIEVRLKMNTATAVKDDYEEDGELEIWVDGVQVAFRNNLVWRKFARTWAIDGLLFSTFFGGSGFSWAPKTKDEYIYFDDFVVSKKRIGKNYDDSDGDGIRDSWEISTFGGVGVSDGVGDADGDGMSDYQEYEAGTDPNDRSDMLEMTCATNASGDMEFNWDTRLQHWYTLERSMDMATWESVGDSMEGTGQPTTQVMAVSAADSKYFYRLRYRRQ